MELYYCKPNLLYKSNEINRATQNPFMIPIITTIRYFFWNYENIYFLALSFSQLLTISVLPKEWSPTGPYSTSIPLIICITAEIIKDIYIWLKNWNLDRYDNNQLYTCLDNNGNLIKKKSKEIYPGDVLRLNTDDICPVDGIMIDNNDVYGKISQSSLTGESNIICVTTPSKKYKYSDYYGSILKISNYYQNNFNNIEATIIKKNEEIKVDGHCFIVGGALIKSDNIYLWVTKCGTEKKSYLRHEEAINKKKSRVDDFVAKYMINVNVLVLLLLITLMTIMKMIVNGNYTLYGIVFYSVQNWILYNGIIPFSIKIFLMLARLAQSILITNKCIVEINNSLQIDDIGKINKIISDKTGTLTKNELEFTKLLQLGSNKIIDVENYDNDEIDLELNKCLGLCIHQSDGVFSTAEDKTIRYRYEYLGNTITQINNKITLHINKFSYDFEYVEIAGLDFTFDRRMSSKLIKHNNKYYLYSKGSMSTIGKKIMNCHKEELNRMDKLISNDCPELRLLICAYREVSVDEIDNLMSTSVNKSLLIDKLENNLILLGVIGIKDNLQKDVPFVINKLKNYGVYVSMCTGDRKITALAIGKEAGLIDYVNNVIDLNDENKNDIIPNINEKTLTFGGTFLENIINDINLRENFIDCLVRCKNFIGYNMIPEHKRKIANLLEQNNTRVLTIGDGFNDVGMFKVGSISVAIKGNPYVESCADFVIKEFSNVQDIFNVCIDSYYKNSKMINYIFYRCSAIVTCIAVHCLVNYKTNSTSLFNGFVIQAFNFIWAFFGMAYYTLRQKNINYNKWDFYKTKTMILTSYELTTTWTICGILTGIFTMLISNYWFGHLATDMYTDTVGLIIITIINIKLIVSNKYDVIGYIASVFGVINYLIYMYFMGTFSDVINSLLKTSYYFWFTTFITIQTINFFLE